MVFSRDSDQQYQLLLSTIWGDPFIKLLTRFNIGKLIRDDQPITHRAKENTPTMGGFMFLVPITLLTVILNAVSLFGSRLLGSSILVPPLSALWLYAIIGALDDWEGIRGTRKGLGMRARTKFILQVIVAIGLAYFLKNVLYVPPHLFWPSSDLPLNLGWAYIPVATIIIVGMCNAVNFTDGIDGLAA